MNNFKVNKVSFKKVNEEVISYNIELYLDFYELLDIINNIESKGLGKSIHIEAFTGIDYLGNKISYDSYLVYTDTKLYKYNFNSDLIPFNNEILIRKRDINIDKLIN